MSTAGLRLGDRRAHALLQALLVFRLLPSGFLNRDLRALLANLLGKHPDDISAGQTSYDLLPAARRRADHPCRRHSPLPHHRHRAAPRHAAQPPPHPTAPPGLALLTDPDRPMPSALRTAARNYQHALDQLTREGAGFAAWHQI